VRLSALAVQILLNLQGKALQYLEDPGRLTPSLNHIEPTKSIALADMVL